MPLLNVNAVHPITAPDGTVITNTVYLQNVIDHPRIAVGVTRPGKAGEVQGD